MGLKSSKIRILISILGLLSIILAVEATNPLPQIPNFTTGCYGAQGNTKHELSFTCSGEEQIVIESVEYGSKVSTSTNCTVGLATERFQECCTRHTTDCNIYYDGGKDDFSYCIGQQTCTFQVVQLDNVNIHYTQCSNNLPTTIYMEAKYYCVPSDTLTINMEDDATQLTAPNIFVQSLLYPDPDDIVNGSCSVETSCGASIITTVIDAQFTCQENGGGFEEQLKDCNNSNNNSFINVIQQSVGDSNFLLFSFNETGRLWLMFKSSDPMANVTVKCGTEADATSTTACTSDGSTPLTSDSTSLTPESTYESSVFISENISVFSESTTLTPESTTLTPESTALTAENTTLTSESTIITHENTPLTSEITALTPESATLTSKNITLTPENTTQNTILTTKSTSLSIPIKATSSADDEINSTLNPMSTFISLTNTWSDSDLIKSSVLTTYKVKFTEQTVREQHITGIAVSGVVVAAVLVGVIIALIIKLKKLKKVEPTSLKKNKRHQSWV